MALVLRQSRQGSRGAASRRGAGGAGDATQFGLQADGSYTIPFGVEVVQKLVRWRRRAVGNLKKRRQAEARVMMSRDVPAAVELEEFWTGVNLAELQTFSLRELRVACASRDLDQIGTRAELIDRILQQQRRDLKRIARAEAFERLQRERLGEAKGAVYAFGQGYGPQVHSWDRCFVRNNLTVLQAMCGRGVVQVQVGFDSRVCVALCENGDVISFGAIRPQDWAPLGYPDSKERRARGNKREELHVAPTAAGAALDDGQKKLAETMGGVKRPLLPAPDGGGVDEALYAGASTTDSGGNVLVARVPFGGGEGSEEEDITGGSDSDEEQLPLRSQTAPPSGTRRSGASGSGGSGAGAGAEGRPGTEGAPRQGEGKDRARRASLTRLVESSPPPRSAMTPAGRRTSLSAPTSTRPLTADGEGTASGAGRRGSGPLRPRSKSGLRDGQEDDGAARGDAETDGGLPAEGGVPSANHGESPYEGAPPGLGLPLGAFSAPTTESQAGMESIDGGSLPSDLELGAGQPMANELPSSLHSGPGSAPRPRTQGSLPPGVVEDGAAARRGRGAQGLPPVEKEMLPTRSQLESDEPDHPSRAALPTAESDTGEADDSVPQADEELGWAVGGEASGVAQRVRGFSVSESRLAEKDRIKSQGQQESTAAVSRQKRARQSLVEVLLEQDAGGKEDALVSSGGKKSKQARRPSLGGPVGLEPLEADEDDYLGRIAVDEATVKKDAAEILPTQPHYNRYGPQGAGNLPAGALNLPKRIPIRKPGSELSGPGVDAAFDAADKMNDVARGKGLHPIDRSFAPPAGRQPISPKSQAKLDREKSLPKLLPPGVDAIGWQQPPGKSPSSVGALLPPGLQDRDHVISTHGGANSVSVDRVRPLNESRASELARNFVADADPRTRGKQENRRRRRRQSQVAAAERRKASKRGRNARGARAKRASDAIQADAKAAAKLKATPVATPVDIPWLTQADRQRWQRAGGNSTGQDALAARREARASVAAAEASPMSGTFSGGSRSGVKAGHGAQLMTRAKARSALLAIGAGTAIAGTGRTLADLHSAGKLDPVPSSSLGRGAAAGPLVPSLNRMPLSGQQYPGAVKTGYAKAVTPRSALQHSLTLRGVATKAQEEEEAKAVGGTLEGHNAAVASLAARQAAEAQASMALGRGTTSRKQLPPLALPSSRQDTEFVRDAREVPEGFEEDDRDPFEAAAKDKIPEEKWWTLSKGAREKGKISAETGMQLAVKAFSKQRLGFAEKQRFDATSWGGEQNYIDIERAVDADMRGYRDFAPPTEVRELRGECIVQVAVSGQHAVAVTSGGDVFVFGASRQGVLGLGGDGRFHSFPFLMDTEEHLGLPAQGRVVGASVGSSHSAVVTSQGELLVFGSSNFGRLGLGSVRNHGPRVQGTVSQGRAGSRLPVAEGQSEAKGKGGALEGGYVSVPTPVPIFSLAAAAAAGGLSQRMRVLQVSCGAAHTVALTDQGVYSWGAADGGRLGIGSHGISQAAAMAARSKTDRSHAGGRGPDPSTLSSRVYDVPQEVKALRGQVVIQVEAAAWHSAAVVQVPPLVEGGWLYVWGSGGVGQLGLGTRTRAEEPELVTSLLEHDVVVAEVSLGRYHSSVLSTDGEVWTWGSNAANCLGRPASIAAEGNPAFTPMPGRVEGLREYGVGAAVSVACGDRCTFISSAPYAPETWPEWRERDMTLLDAARERRGAMMDRATGGAQDDVLRLAVDRAKEERQKLLELNRDRPLCVLAPPSDGSVLGSQAEALGGMAVRKGKELDKRAREREEAENAGDPSNSTPASARPTSSARTGSASGGRRQAECTGFVARLFAPNKCDVCGHERRYHTLLRRVPPLEELVDRFTAAIEREEQLEFEYDALRARRAATGAARAAQFARGGGGGASPQ